MAAPGDPYADTSAIGMSLWFVAAAPHEGALAALIAKTAAGRARPGSRDFPVFHPHITVAFWNRSVPMERIDEAATELAASLAPFDVTFTRAAKGNIFFQCVYALCDPAPPLVDANAAIQRRFGMRYAYMPHLSLAYGDVAEGDKDGLVAALAPRVDGRVVPVDRLELWDTSGPVEAWRRVKAYPLSLGARGGEEAGR